MGLFDNLLGNASKANLDDIRQDYAKLLANGESIQQAYEIFRDLFIFTDIQSLYQKGFRISDIFFYRPGRLLFLILYNIPFKREVSEIIRR